ncbi:putative metallophosphoesterase protein [Rhizobium phage RHph_Y68]|uniref:Putative metallophosphoesterase protein n=1 Tax=Rhizobium phage RHph_Y68 TaxID=2509787 RepID=A0A7S5R3P9_9CAUD|nr:metallo-phosphoesterase [Rhizobium phage RHph_Y68]QIG68191.1 putative metallophosphoesterase protein [Rhizobium phage RHph_Y68]
MKAWVLSDLHHDQNEWLAVNPPSEADIAIVAGDVCSDLWLTNVALQIPTFYVAGNHCFKNEDFFARRQRFADISKVCPDFRFLDNSSVVYEGVQIFGGTLWTDFAGGNDELMENCLRTKGDYKRIWKNKEGSIRWKPHHALSEFRKTKRFIEHTLLSDHEEKTVVVTHHAPSYKSIAPEFANSPLNGAYASQLDYMIEGIGPDFWIHGHTHNSADYMINRTRVINNPHGHYGENKKFDPGLIITI